jgi:hypothetical protein
MNDELARIREGAVLIKMFKQTREAMNITDAGIKARKQDPQT